MQLTFNPQNNSLLVTMSDVEYGLMRQADAVELQRLFLSFMQLLQDREKTQQTEELRSFLERATPDQKAELVSNVNAMKSEIVEKRVER